MDEYLVAHSRLDQRLVSVAVVDPYLIQLSDTVPQTEQFKVQSRKPLVKFLKQGIQPPSYVYVTEQDDIVVGCASSQAGEVVTISYRLLLANGDLQTGQFTVSPASDRSLAVHSEDLAEGFLLSVSCKAAVATTRGQTFVRAFLSNPSLGQGFPSYMLMADYVTTAMSPAHPNGRVLAPSEGPGAPRTIPATVPAAGSFITISAPTNARWKIHSLITKLTTSAVVAARTVHLQVTSSGLASYFAPAANNQPAATACTYGASTFPAYLSPAATLGMLSLPVDLIMLGIDNVIVGALALDVGDQFNFLQIMVEEWLDNV